MDTMREVVVRRERILEEMRSMHSMKRGSITEQYLKVRHKGKKEPVLRGPYYVFSRKEGGRTVSKRLRSPGELEQTRSDVAAHRRFVELCKEFEVLTERLGELERDMGEVERVKKGRRLRSRRTRR